jgi:hypothetical protein
MKAKKQRPVPYVRVNTRIKKEHSILIKDLAKKTNKTEGEVVRAILDKYFKIK